VCGCVGVYILTTCPPLAAGHWLTANQKYMGLFCGCKGSLEHIWGSFEETHALHSQQLTGQQQIKNIWGSFAHLERALWRMFRAFWLTYRALLRKYLPATGKQVNGKSQIFRAILRKYSFFFGNICLPLGDKSPINCRSEI